MYFPSGVKGKLVGNGLCIGLTQSTMSHCSQLREQANYGRMALSGLYPWLHSKWKILPTRIETNSVLCFLWGHNSISLMRVQPHLYCLWWSEPCHDFEKAPRHSSWAIELSVVLPNNEPEELTNCCSLRLKKKAKPSASTNTFHSGACGLLPVPYFVPAHIYTLRCLSTYCIYMHVSHS